MKKTYVLDTNVLLSDPNCFSSFDDNDLLLPLVVLEELDTKKNRPDEIGQNARIVNRFLDDERKKGSLFDGITLSTGGTLKVAYIDNNSFVNLPVELLSTKADNKIIAFMLLHKDAILVSQDINMRLKCDSLGIKCEDYKKIKVSIDVEQLYKGVSVINVDGGAIEELYKNNETSIDKIQHLNLKKIYPNHIFVVKSEQSQSVLARVSQSCDKIQKIKSQKNVFGLEPKNKEQAFSLDLLLDPKIKLITLSGVAGTGKTLLALAAGMAQTKGVPGTEDALYEKLIVTKPVQPMGKDIGFLPGDLKEKMDPWMSPIRDNLEFLLCGKKRQSTKNEPYISLLQEKGIIEVEALTFIRGRSIHKAFFIIDEAQNLSIHEVKTIITRAGEGTKIIMTGDIDQIDNMHVDAYTNGLSYVIEKFKDQPIAAHVTLVKGERSELATIATKIM